jgi:hypothetical protein
MVIFYFSLLERDCRSHDRMVVGFTTICPRQTWSYHIVSNTLRREFESNPQLTDCTDSCKSNCHTIMTTIVPFKNWKVKDHHRKLIVYDQVCRWLAISLYGFLWDSSFPPPIQLIDRPLYNWNIVESGIKRHNHIHILHSLER